MVRWAKFSLTWLLPLLVIVLMVVGAQALRTTVPAEEYQQCLNAAQNDHAKEAQCQHDETVWERTLSDPVAYYTLWLTIFTAVLAVVGIVQGYFVWQQIRLGRDEFDASHRPQIIVHTVEYSTDAHPKGITEHPCVGAEVTYFNRGDAAATSVSIYGNIFEIEGRPLAGLKFKPILDRQRCIPGSPNTFGAFSEIPSLAHEVTTMLASEDEGTEEPPSNIYCIGTISYFDNLGVRRVTGYCWRLHGKRWVRQTRSAYEYAY